MTKLKPDSVPTSGKGARPATERDPFARAHSWMEGCLTCSEQRAGLFSEPHG